VPAELVKLLHERGHDPLRQLLARLDDLGCDRRRLRPETPLLGYDSSAGPLKERAKDLAQQTVGPCRKALEELFGLGADAPSEP
jgi:hypothetical protein